MLNSLPFKVLQSHNNVWSPSRFFKVSVAVFFLANRLFNYSKFIGYFMGKHMPDPAQ